MHQRIQGRSFEQRIADWSLWLQQNVASGRKTPEFGPAPESQDVVPWVPDQFDCTTYVETVFALARVPSSQGVDARRFNSREFYEELKKIRYHKGVPDFAHRNHFPEADWIQNNAEAGLLSDVTERIASQAGVQAQVETKKLFKSRWLSKQAKAGHVQRSVASALEPKWSEPLDVSVKYLAIADVPKAIGHLPNGAVVNLVRKSDERFDVLISHQGFIIRDESKPGEVYLRHANRKGKIQTLPLLQYLKLHAKDPWPVVGLNFSQFNSR